MPCRWCVGTGRRGRRPLRVGCKGCGSRADVGIGPYGMVCRGGRPPVRPAWWVSWGCVGEGLCPSCGRDRTPPLRMTRSAWKRVVGEIAEALPAAEEARRFRGNAPIGGHDSGRQSAGTTVGNRRLLRMFTSSAWAGDRKGRPYGFVWILRIATASVRTGFAMTGYILQLYYLHYFFISPVPKRPGKWF